ncbi:hypothetical protein STEG23_030497, partial [Scotinomys teguina]
PQMEELENILTYLPKIFKEYGLIIAPEKIQKDSLINYLGYVVNRTTVRPQKVSIRRDRMNMLNDFQKLLGDINWIWPTLGIPTYQLHNLFSILQGDTDLSSSRTLTKEAEKELQFVEQRLKDAFLIRVDIKKSIMLYISDTWKYPTGILGQDEQPLQWIYTRHRFSKNVMPYEQQMAIIIEHGRQRVLTLSGNDVAEITFPLPKDQVEYLLHMSEYLQIALAHFMGQFGYHFPKGKLWDCFSKQQFVINEIISMTPPVNANTIFTDGSKTKCAYWTSHNYWVQQTSLGSVQQNELFAIIKVLQDFPEEINIVADLAYAVGVVTNIVNTVTYSPKLVLQDLFDQLQKLLQQHNARVHITHIQAHSTLPEPMVYGNQQVDKLVAFATPEQDHAHLHTNAGHLHIKYKIPYAKAKQIVKQCPICRPMHLQV